uniref:Transposase n=1 Tax=Heterorhabditis bacteriophora TaxID=37862 RepID=A0A1I7XJS2_HETBA
MDDEVFSASCPYTVAEPGTITSTVICFYRYPVKSGIRKILDCPPMSTNRPVCLVCGRTQTSKIKLFKWPKDEPVRRSW